MTETTDSEEFTPEELAEARLYSMLIQWSPEDGLYIVSCPELPNLHTHGATHHEAVEMGAEAIATYLFGLRSHGWPVPEPRYFGSGADLDGAG